MPAPVGNKLIGSSVTRQEDRRLLLGHGRYIGDIKLHRMVHAAILRSSLAHARIVSVDTAACTSDPRCLAVVTAADLGEVPRLVNADGLPSTKPFLQSMIAIDKVRFVGEPIAVVIAATRHEAEDLLELIEVEYDPLPAVVDVDEALQPDAPILHKETNVAETLRFSTGDPNALDRAPHVFRGRFEIQRHAGMPIETRGVVVEWDAGLDGLTIHTSTQVPHFIKSALAAFLGLPEGSVRVLVPDVGGAFGSKIQIYPEEYLVAIVGRILRRPVKWIEDRTEHFLGTTHGREQYHEVEVGYDDDGVILAVRDSIVTNTGAYLQAFSITEASLAAILLRGPYRVRDFEAVSKVVVTNKTPMSPFRGVGMVQPVFVMEGAIDSIARHLGLDPVEVRLRNMLTPDELPYDLGVANTLSGQFVYDSGDYPNALRLALELAEYNQVRDRQIRGIENGRRLGIGVASYVELSGMGPWESALVRVEPSGKVVVTSGSGPSGQGTATTLAQIVADRLGVAIADVVVVHGDTARVQRGVGSYGSRIATVGGTATEMAADAVAEKAKTFVAEKLEAFSGDIELRGGRAFVKGSPESGLSLAEVAAGLEPGNPLPHGIKSYGLEATETFTPPGNAFAYGTVIATVEVDIETGVVTPIRLVMVGDAGTMINPLLIDGQYQGGLALGLAGALFEEIVYDEHGQPTNPNFVGFLMPQLDNIPEIILGHTQVPSPHNQLGMKGAGESGAIAPPAALANAVSDALSGFGIEIRETPISPERVLELIGQARPERSRHAPIETPRL